MLIFQLCDNNSSNVCLLSVFCFHGFSMGFSKYVHDGKASFPIFLFFCSMEKF